MVHLVKFLSARKVKSLIIIFLIQGERVGVREMLLAHEVFVIAYGGE